MNLYLVVIKKSLLSGLKNKNKNMKCPKCHKKIEYFIYTIGLENIKVDQPNASIAEKKD